MTRENRATIKYELLYGEIIKMSLVAVSSDVTQRRRARHAASQETAHVAREHHKYCPEHSPQNVTTNTGAIDLSGQCKICR